ncbi:transposase IS4 family protein [Actinobacteria bacterium OV450]|nr:transposase IS4 family protein [Actinobacteria bacterium OV450]
MHCRLARDYETKPEHSESMIRIAAISTLTKRATNETTSTRRDA